MKSRIAKIIALFQRNYACLVVKVWLSAPSPRTKRFCLIYLNKFFFRQCDETFPDGVACDENAEDVTQADPENCWKYYKCHGGCVTHETCEEDYKYDDRFQWCTSFTPKVPMEPKNEVLQNLYFLKNFDRIL